ncbi:MAG: hypothetical protein IH899_13655, partial [Planctomycetes bacterium]|nr:hypothetical protein [Planctomycetota bacterium]
MSHTNTLAGTVGLYIQRGSIPTLSQFDASVTTFLDADPELRLLEPLEDTYFVGVYGQYLPFGPSDFTLSAELTPLELQSVTQTTVANTGQATLELLGNNFSASDSVFLVAPDNVTELAPLNIVNEDPSRTYATFDLTGVAVGAYDLVVEPATGEQVNLLDVLEVVADDT